MNSSNYKYQYWNGNLSPQQSTTILLSAIPISGNSHIINVEIIAPNNTTDLNTSDNTDVKLFQTSTGTSININLITDNYAEENSWILFDENNNIIDSDDSLVNNKHYIYNYCLKDACYKLVVNDTEGDGFCCDYGNGKLSVNKELDNIELASLTTFSFTDTIEFCVTALTNKENERISNSIIPNPTCGIISIKNDNFKNSIPILAEVLSIEGKLISSEISLTKTFNFRYLKNGIYLIKLKQNENILFNKLVINK